MFQSISFTPLLNCAGSIVFRVNGAHIEIPLRLPSISLVIEAVSPGPAAQIRPQKPQLIQLDKLHSDHFNLYRVIEENK